VLQAQECPRASLGARAEKWGTHSADSTDHCEIDRELPSSPDPDWLPPPAGHPLCGYDHSLNARTPALATRAATSAATQELSFEATGLSATDLLAMISSEPRIELTLKAFHTMTVSHGVKTETWE
jgi:hypothetical protein